MRKRLCFKGLVLVALSSGALASPFSPAQPDCLPAPTVVAGQADERYAMQAGGDFLIVANERFGPIHSGSSEEALKELFGASQVRREKMYVGDGQEWDGVAIYPDQPEKRVEVFWFEEDASKVQLIQVHGERSEWKTSQGVTLGTTLLELERLNGRPFDILGLGWDFGGGIVDWKGGVLEGLTLRCDHTTVELTDQESAAVMGDQTVSSSLPAMRKANPAVSKITLSFSLPSTEEM